MKDGKKRTIHIYNVCDHARCWKEVRAQAISYTTGVPAAIGARLIVTGTWCDAGVFNVEQFTPDPFMQELTVRGLPWVVKEL